MLTSISKLSQRLTQARTGVTEEVGSKAVVPNDRVGQFDMTSGKRCHVICELVTADLAFGQIRMAVLSN